MLDQSSEKSIERALQDFERNLVTPVVPGELDGWVANVRQSLASVGLVLRQAVGNAHRDSLSEIRRQDPDLSSRVDDLLEEDQRLLRQFGDVSGSFAVLVDGSKDPDNPSQSIERRLQLAKQSLEFVGRVRTQEAAIRTWQQEAFMRDRGVAD